MQQRNFQNYLPKSMTYLQYLELIDRLHAENKVTGATQSEELLDYSLLNKKRTERLNKTAKVQEDILAELSTGITTQMIWLTITEGWCGDAAQIIPYIEALAVALPNQVQHRVVLRDENPELIDLFLTNGGRAIPKMILLDAKTGDLLGHWGPRPRNAQAIMNAYKAAVQGVSEEEKEERYAIANTQLHTWYAHNKGVDIQREFADAVLAKVLAD